MIDVKYLVRTAGTFVTKNAPAILTGIGVATSLASSVLAYKAGMLSKAVLDAAPEESKATFFHKAALTWKLWTPSLALAAISATCVIGANAVHAKRLAAIAGIYAITDNNFKEYQEKVGQMFGSTQPERVSEAVVEEHMAKTPATKSYIFDTQQGDTLFFDDLSGRYFLSDIETVRKAQNDLNNILYGDAWVSLNRLYELLELPTVSLGEDLGWVPDNMVDIKFMPKLTENNRPCIALTYKTDPRFLRDCM